MKGPSTPIKILRHTNYQSTMADVRASRLQLPAAPTRKGLYAPARISGSCMYVSGHPPIRPDGSYVTGVIGMFSPVWHAVSSRRPGRDLSVAEGKEAARLTGLAIIATIAKELGSLDRVVRVVKTLGMLHCTDTFEQHPEVHLSASMSLSVSVSINRFPYMCVRIALFLSLLCHSPFSESCCFS